MLTRIAVAMLVFGLAVAATPADANACSCFPATVSSSYGWADLVAQVKVGRQLKDAPDGTVRWLGTALEGFKGCVGAGDSIIIETNASSAACGVNLDRATYLLYGYDAGVDKASGRTIMHIGSCDYNRLWDELFPSDIEYLYGRYSCCGDFCGCVDGDVPVMCFVDPCQVSTCDVEGATCMSNYCGGCNAEWYDSFGHQVCNDECVTDADCSSDTWCRQDEVGVMRCTPFVGAGETCEGFVLPWYHERCEEGLQCVHSEPTYDVPGVCATCDFNGTPYMAGETFETEDGCNTCTCSEGGFIGCTEMACIEQPKGGPGPKCGPVRCGKGEVCCNESCGICTPPDGFCTDQVCAPAK